MATAGDDVFVMGVGVGCGVEAGVAAGVGLGVAGLGVVRRRWAVVTPNKTQRTKIERVSLAKFILLTGARAFLPAEFAQRARQLMAAESYGNSPASAKLSN